MKILDEINAFLPRKFVYCDVGARGGISNPWKRFEKWLKVISFEPDPEEFERLLKEEDSNNTFYPYALYKESSQIPFYLTKAKRCSSIYQPNLSILKNYPDWKRYEIEETINIEATSLDNLASQISEIDFIKLDVQGAELDILNGGVNFLKKNAIGIEVEIAFQQVYQKQANFSMIDQFVCNELGMHIQDIKKLYWKYPQGINVGAKKGQLIFGDAIYFRSPYEILSWCSNFELQKARTKALMACIMGIVYGYLDYSLCLLNQPISNDFFDQKFINKLKNLINMYGRSLRFETGKITKLGDLFYLLYQIFRGTHEGWATIDSHLGSEKKFNIFRS